MLRTWCLWWSAIAPASGATLAVLPFEAGGAAEVHPGLGRAFAGLFVADLVDVPGLVLVERDRLDAVLAEIALGTDGYLDPARAVAAGRGVGAEWVLLGSYAVVDDTIVVEGRVVDVATGEIRAAATSDGVVAGFVDVEKRVVAELLVDLDVAPDPIATAPTAVFDAFAAWGAALDAEARRDDDAAVASWERALSRDPTFTLARSAVARLRASREAFESADADGAAAADTERWTAALDATVSARPRTRRKDLAASLVRWHALWRLDRHCERAASMRAVLDAAGWDASALPPSGDAARKLVFELGLDVPDGYGGWPSDPALSTATGLLFDTERLVLHYDAGSLGDPRSQSLVASMLRCDPPSAWPADLAALVAEVEGRGLADLSTDAEYPTWTFGYRLRTVAARLEAETVGLRPETTEWLAGLFDDPNLGDDGRAYARMRVEQIERAESATRRREARMQGLSEAEIIGLARAIASQDDVTAPEAPGCAEVLRDAAARVTPPLDRAAAPGDWPGDPARRMVLAELATATAPALDLGCIRGVPAPFPDLDAAIDHVLAAVDRVSDDPACGTVAADVARQVAAARGMGLHAPDVARYDLIRWYRQEPYASGCLGVEPRVLR